MEGATKKALACLCGLFWLNCIYCDVPSDGSGTFSLTCICSPRENMHSSATNCSRLCSCVSDRGIDKSGWNCSCGSSEIGSTAWTVHNDGCFKSCNCTNGLLETAHTGKQISKAIIVVILLCGLLAAVTILALVLCYYFYQKDKIYIRPTLSPYRRDLSWSSRTNSTSKGFSAIGDFQHKPNYRLSPVVAFARKLSFIIKTERVAMPGMISQFSYAELELATEKFSDANLVGKGGSSEVYHGWLDDGKVVAVKKFRTREQAEAEAEFLTEIELLSRLNHRHVVPLLGFCSAVHRRKFERLLVFEYMPNGSLRDCLNVQGVAKPLNWETRVAIAIGVARGLEYLHEAAAPRILHRDIKSTNILLDDKYRPKITDLGMAKRLMVDDPESCAASPARMQGTFGYFAPEYAIVGKASLKSDVFSFGVVVLELITGRQPILKSANNIDESLVLWAMPRIRDSKLVVSELPDPLLEGKFPKEEMQIMAHLARECLQWEPDLRPTMGEVVQILSVIAPGVHKLRNFRAGLLMASSCEVSEKAHIRTVLPPVNNQNFYQEPLPCSGNTATAATALLTRMDQMGGNDFFGSNSERWHTVNDEEVVDLTEPRYEAFLEANMAF